MKQIITLTIMYILAFLVIEMPVDGYKAIENAANIISYRDYIITLYNYITRHTASELSTVLTYSFDDEQTNISYYVEIDGEKLKPAYKNYLKEARKFGFEFDGDELKKEIKDKKQKTFDNKIFYQIDSSEEYFKSPYNPYVLERNLTGQKKNVKNQIGQLEERQLKRFLSFEGIFSKEHNIFNITTREVNQTECLNPFRNATTFRNCTTFINQTVNTTIKQPRNIGFSLIQQGKNWIAEFFNIFDLDPRFIDDTDTNWNAGTFNSMFTSGTGASANLSANNISGHFASQVFDSANTNANWTNISIVTEAAYGAEIGRSTGNNVGDGLNQVLPYVNTSGLVLLMHFNNESNFGENDTNATDFSIYLNPESNVSNNGTLKDGAHYNFTNKRMGAGAIGLNGINNFVESSNINGLNGIQKLTVSLWAEQDSLAVDKALVAKWDYQTQGSWGLQTGQTNSNEIQYFIATSLTDNGAGSQGETVGVGRVAGMWNHIVMVYDGTQTGNDNRLKIYVDGINVTISHSGTVPNSLTSATSTVKIGKFGGTLNRFFNGNIDEVAIWNRSLSASEIQNLYLRGAYQLNLSVRSCSDSTCSGSTAYMNFTNNVTSGATIKLNLSANRYFQYNLTYSNQSAYRFKLNINNISIEFENVSVAGGDTTSPIVNTTFNITSPLVNDVINFTGNITDETGLLSANITYNISGVLTKINFTISGTSATIYNVTNFTGIAGDVINFTMYATDTSNNVKQNSTLITLTSPATNTCSCPSSGDWNINMANNCIITTNCNMNGNNVHSYGTGTLTINAVIFNFKNIFFRGNVFCYKSPSCFG